jgi:hypothetical protein
MSSPRDPTQFTRESAERIATVVRAAELSTPNASPLSFAREDFFRNRKIFRIATFAGAWPTGVEKVVTFKYQTQTPNTASAVNLFYPIAKTAAAGDCAIAKDGTAWFLIDVPFETATAVFVGATTTGIVVSSTQSTSRVTDVTLSATLNTSNCTISIGKTLVTASTIFVTGTATSVFVQSTFTATFVRFRE